MKKLVDEVIDNCKRSSYFGDVLTIDYSCYILGDHVKNLREEILIWRLKYSLTSNDDEESEREKYLDRAVKALEK